MSGQDLKGQGYDFFSQQHNQNFGALSLMQGDGKPITTAEGVSYSPILEDPKQVDEFFKVPGEDEIMSKVQDPSDIAEAKAKVKAKEDELSGEIMKSTFLDNQDSIMNNFGTNNNFMDEYFNNPPMEIDIKGSLDTQLIKGAKNLYEAESERVEKILIETVPNFMGSEAVSGFLNMSDRDRLQRKISFAERRAYWKRVKGEDAQYFRMPIAKLKNGKTVYEELVSLTPDGEVYRVDPSGALTAREIFNDIGDITGTLLTARTGLTIGAALFGGVLGPGVVPAVYGGSYFGQIIDNFLVSEGVDPKNTQSITQRLLDGDAAMLALFDTAMTFIPPIVGRAIMDKVRGDPLRILPIGGVTTQAVKAQQTAEAFKLAPLTVTQVADDPTWNGIFSQVGAISRKIPDILKNQKKSVYNYLNKIVEKTGLDSISPNNLRYYVNGKLNTSMDNLKNIIEENMKGITYSVLGKKQTVPGSGGSSFQTLKQSKQPYNVNTPTLNSQKFVESLNEIKNANFKINNSIWQKALSSENSKGVYFDTKSLKELANEIKTGVYTKVDTTIPASTKTSNIIDPSTKTFIKTDIAESTVSEAKQLVNFKSDLADILDTLTRLTDDQVGNFTVSTTGGGSKTFSGVKQLQTIRQKLNGMLGKDNYVPPEVLPSVRGLIKEIDNVILNPKGANTNFIKSWKEGNAFHTMNKDIESFSKLSTLFSREASVNPHEYVKKFWSGEWGVPELNLLNKYVSTVKRTGTESQKRHAFNLESAMENGFGDFIMYNPVQGIDKLGKIMADPALFKALVPNPKNRVAYTNFYNEQTWIRNGSAKKILEQADQAQGNAKKFLENANETEIWDFINFPKNKTLKGYDRTGMNSEMASDLRASVIDDIITRTRNVVKGDETSNINALSSELDRLANFKGIYAKYKPLFVPSKGKLSNGEIQYLKPSKLQTDYAQNLSDLSVYVSFVKDTPDVGGAFSAGSVRSDLTSLRPWKVFEAGKILMANDIWARILARPISVAQLQRMTGTGSLITSPKVINALSSALSTTFEPYQGMFPNVGTRKDTIKEELDKSGKIKPLGVGPPDKVSSLMPNTMPLQNLSPAPNLASLQVPKSNVKSSKVDYGLLFPNDPIGEAINQRKQGIMGLT